MGTERRRDACPGVRRGRGRRPCEGISLCDGTSPTLAVVSAANADMELDSESRIREIRSSGLMRGEVAGKKLTIAVGLIPYRHFAYSTQRASINNLSLLNSPTWEKD